MICKFCSIFKIEKKKQAANLTLIANPRFLQAEQCTCSDIQQTASLVVLIVD